MAATTWAEAAGVFDRKTGEAHETVKFSRGLPGSVRSLLRCTGDPWLGSSSCTVEAENASVGPKWSGAISQRVMRDKLSFSRGPVSLSEAESSSTKHTGSSASPAPKPNLPAVQQRSKLLAVQERSELPAVQAPSQPVQPTTNGRRRVVVAPFEESIPGAASRGCVGLYRHLFGG